MPVTDVANRALRALEREVRVVWRSQLVRRGTDVTERVARASCLVIAPHPDDQILGCGATIARKRAVSTPVRVLVAADGGTSHRSALIRPDELADRRRQDVLAACGELGVAERDVVLLGLADDTLVGHRDELAARIREQLDDFAPDEVRVPSPRDWHADHRNLRAALDVALEDRVQPVRVLEYPVWFWMHGPWEADAAGPWASLRLRTILGGPFSPGAWPEVELVATAGFLGAKLRALRTLESQPRNLTGGASRAVLGDEVVAAFLLPYELSFPVHRPAFRAKAG